MGLRTAVLGMFAMQGFWLKLAILYRWPGRYRSALTMAIALAPVVVFFVGVVTNASHGWFILPGGDWNPALVAWAGPGTWALFLVIFLYGLTTTGIFAFAGMRMIWRGEPRPGIALTLAVLIAPIFSFDAGASDPQSLLSVSAAAITICIVVISLTALRYQLLEPPPLGHREVIDHLRHGVLMASPVGEILDHNLAAERLLGSTPRGDAIADSVARIADPGSRDSVREALASVSTAGRSVSFQLDASGGRTLEISAHPIGDEYGEPLGQFAMLRDRTEERRFTDAALRSEKLETLGTLAAGIAHEVNNPLAFVRANLGEIARLGRVIDERVADGKSPLARELRETGALAREAQRGLERIQRAVSDVRRLAAAPDTGDEAFSIDSVVRDAVQLAQRRADPLPIEMRLAPELPPLSGSEQLLVQAVLSLLLDARHALAGTPEPRIEVETGSDEDGVFVRVRDNGPGVPEPLRGRTFEGSFAGLPDASRVGLGLSVAAGIAHDHGGSLRTEPAASGGGYLLRVAVAAEL
jgi:signal transduction histidine kinase